MIAAQLADTPVDFVLPSWKVGIHEAFEEFPVVRNMEMEKLVDDDDLLEACILAEKLFT